MVIGPGFFFQLVFTGFRVCEIQLLNKQLRWSRIDLKRFDLGRTEWLFITYTIDGGH